MFARRGKVWPRTAAAGFAEWFTDGARARQKERPVDLAERCVPCGEKTHRASEVKNAVLEERSRYQEKTVDRVITSSQVALLSFVSAGVGALLVLLL
jgi:hypothetical protein